MESQSLGSEADRTISGAVNEHNTEDEQEDTLHDDEPAPEAPYISFAQGEGNKTETEEEEFTEEEQD